VTKWVMSSDWCCELKRMQDPS